MTDKSEQSMPYPPSYHLNNDRHLAYRVITACKLATVISPTENDVMVTHIPLILDPDKGELGSLIGHIDRNNPQTGYLSRHSVTAIFHGPDAYISPTVYHSRQLPTWNYITVHITGAARLLCHDETAQSLIHMAEVLEAGDQPFVLAPDDKRMLGLLPYIVGFEIDIEKLTGRFKLSQDKSRQDMLQAKQQLKSHAARHQIELIDQLLSIEV